MGQGDAETGSNNLEQLLTFTLLIAALVLTITDYIWYNPQVFGKVWMQDSGITENRNFNMKNGIKSLLLPATYDDLRSAFFSLKKVAGKIRHDLTDRNKLKQFHGKTGLLLNIGCGPLTAPGWINMDTVIKAEGVFYCDVRDPIPLADGSVRHIHSEHFLPHLR